MMNVYLIIPSGHKFLYSKLRKDRLINFTILALENTVTKVWLKKSRV